MYLLLINLIVEATCPVAYESGSENKVTVGRHFAFFIQRFTMQLRSILWLSSLLYGEILHFIVVSSSVDRVKVTAVYDPSIEVGGFWKMACPGRAVFNGRVDSIVNPGGVAAHVHRVRSRPKHHVTFFHPLRNTQRI